MDPDVDPTWEAKIDGLAREALSRPPSVTERLVTTALARGRRRRTGTRVHVALATVAAMALVAFVIGRSFWPPRDAHPEYARGTLTNDGGVMIVEMPGSPITLIGPNADALALPAGTVSIKLLGEAR